MAARIAAAALVVCVLADQKSLDCPLRQLGLDYASKLQPFRAPSVFQEFADALNGAVEAQNCNVKPSLSAVAIAGRPAAKERVLSFPLPTSGLVIFADPAADDSLADGSSDAPYGTLHGAVEAVRRARAASGITSPTVADRATIVLRAGTFHIGRTLQLTAADSHLTFQAHPDDDQLTWISGAVPIVNPGGAPVVWQPATPPPRQAYEWRAGALEAGFDLMPPASYTVAQAQAACSGMPLCAGFTYNNANPNPSGAVQVTFKYALFWARGTTASTYVKNRGYLPGGGSLYVADISQVGLTRAADGLRVNGTRGIRARYPNVDTAELLGAMQVTANSWTAQSEKPVAAYTFNPSTPYRNESTNNGAHEWFSTFKIGVGGACASRFTPNASYWCSDNSEGGGPGPYQAPVGMVLTNASDRLPHTPYTHSVAGAAVHSWRAGRWFSWVFEVESATFSGGSTTFHFGAGGHQGSRGGNAGQEFFIENLLDELDAPGEYYHDVANQQLYLWHNATGAPANGSVVATQLVVLVNTTGTQAQPVVGVSFLGLGFRDSAPAFLEPHGTPSGGDWAVSRTGALFFEGASGVTINGCLFSSLDGNGVFFSGFVRGANVTANEFVSIGETAIAQWGYTDGSPVPGMGFDATGGNQPRGTLVDSNYVHEVGLWTKQNSFYFQSESYGNMISNNLAFNGPRAGINFDDGMGGGSSVTRNVLANFCRESSDHGPFNSWNRQVYVTTGADGNPTTRKLNDTITYNFILANYHSSMAIDNDDGSSWFDTHSNVFVSASQGAAYGGNSLKTDFGGHSNFHHGNLDLFFSKGFGITSTIAGFADGYYDNYLYLGTTSKSTNYGDGQSCSGPTATIVRNNTVWVPAGTAITECGMSLSAFQAQGGDPGTTASKYPDDAVVLGVARSILGM